MGGDADRDLAELRRVVDELRSTEAKYRSLVETSPVVVYLDAYDEAGVSIYMSPQVEDLLGYPPGDWVGNPTLWGRILHPDDYERAMADQEEALRTFGRWREEYRMIAKDGSVVWVHDEAVVVRDHHGQPLGWQGVWIDITARKQVEEDLGASLAREREAVARLQEAHEAKDTLLHAVSHDLRSALTTMLGAAITLERSESELAPQERRELLAGLSGGARRANRIVNDLLDMDRLERGLVTAQRSRFDLAELAVQLVDDLGVSDRITVEAQPLEIEADAPKVERMLENLLTNLVRHTPEGTPGRLSIRSADGGALIVLEDEGPGVEDSRKVSIFEPFHREQSGTGIGIGLSLVGRFAELHGGRAWVTDRQGGGAAFHVLLPSG